MTESVRWNNSQAENLTHLETFASILASTSTRQFQIPTVPLPLELRGVSHYYPLEIQQGASPCGALQQTEQ